MGDLAVVGAAALCVVGAMTLEEVAAMRPKARKMRRRWLDHADRGEVRTTGRSPEGYVDPYCVCLHCRTQLENRS